MCAGEPEAGAAARPVRRHPHHLPPRRGGAVPGAALHGEALGRLRPGRQAHLQVGVYSRIRQGAGWGNMPHAGRGRASTRAPAPGPATRDTRSTGASTTTAGATSTSRYRGIHPALTHFLLSCIIFIANLLKWNLWMDIDWFKFFWFYAMDGVDIY